MASYTESTIEFAKEIADAAALCESAWIQMTLLRDINAQWGQSKEYQAAYHVHNDAVNERHTLLRDNHAKIEKMAIMLLAHEAAKPQCTCSAPNGQLECKLHGR